MFGQRNYIFRTFAQWRNAQLKLSETMKKILAKSSSGDRRIQILVGGGNDAYIDLNFAVAAQAVKRISIQHA